MGFKRIEDLYPECASETAKLMRVAADAGISGWNIRCNLCGAFGASWIINARPGWGSLALCPSHKEAYEAEMSRHRGVISTLSQINFEQPVFADAAASMALCTAWRNRHTAGAER
jgi:hypothetical protein